MEAILQLFRKRDKRIRVSYDDVNSQSHNFEPYKESLFCPTNTITYISEDNINILIPDILDWHKYQRVYLPICKAATSNCWMLIVIEIEEKKVYCINPTMNDSLIIQTLKETIKQKLNPFLIQINNLFNNFNFTIHPNLYFEPLQNSFDSGIYIVSTIYYLAYNSPVYFKENDMIKTRFNFAYWLMNESLPL
jgi:hypothetical protein